MSCETRSLVILTLSLVHRKDPCISAQAKLRDKATQSNDFHYKFPIAKHFI